MGKAGLIFGEEEKGGEEHNSDEVGKTRQRIAIHLIFFLRFSFFHFFYCFVCLFGFVGFCLFVCLHAGSFEFPCQFSSGAGTRQERGHTTTTIPARSSRSAKRKRCRLASASLRAEKWKSKKSKTS